MTYRIGDLVHECVDVVGIRVTPVEYENITQPKLISRGYPFAFNCKN